MTDTVPRDHGGPGRLPELLAPAGSPDAFRAAVAAGADAVYLGGKRFGARQYAANFSENEIGAAITYAHARGVKVYVTVNTLIHDRELEEAAGYLVWLYEAGADAVLVQDLGLAALAREIVPGLPLHASTQMTIHNADGVRYAAGLGFSRVVPARELTLAEVESIARNTADTGVGLEVFAHGALCMAYSGQCLLSSVIGGRSGNRGMCAQPCRKPYTFVIGRMDRFGRPLAPAKAPQDGRYLLSPRDLCTYPRLERLVRSPVVSLKIEGRMKSPEYVAIVTAAYRRALDAIGGSSPLDTRQEVEKLALAFNRGFTDGYLFEKRHSSIMGKGQADNRGLHIGTVERYLRERGSALVRLTTNITPVAGDGLFIAGTDRKEKGLGFALNKTPERERNRILLPVSEPVHEGASVFLTSSTALSAEFRRILAGDFPELRHPVLIDCRVSVSSEGYVTMNGTIGAGSARPVTIGYSNGVPLVPARTRPLSARDLLANLGKTGGTPFVFRTLAIDYDGSRFAPVSEINRIRREFLAQAEQALVAAYRPPEQAVIAARERLASVFQSTGTDPGGPVSAGSPEVTIAVYTDTLEGVEAAARAGCGRICYEPDITAPNGQNACSRQHRETIGLLRTAMATCRIAGVPFAWKLPRITRDAELAQVRRLVPPLCHEGLAACMADSMGAASVIAALCPGIAVLGSSGLNIFNHRSAQQAATLCSSVTLSPELSGPEIRKLIRMGRAALCPVSFELVVQGNAEAMVAENCLLEPVRKCNKGEETAATDDRFYGLRDSTGRVFPVRLDGSCRTHVLNADETCLLDHLPEIIGFGISTLAIDARGRTPEYIRRIVRIYQDAVCFSQNPEKHRRPSDLAELKEQARAIALGQLTAVHYLRGLQES